MYLFLLVQEVIVLQGVADRNQNEKQCPVFKAGQRLVFICLTLLNHI